MGSYIHIWSASHLASGNESKSGSGPSVVAFFMLAASYYARIRAAPKSVKNSLQNLDTFY